MVIYLIFRAGHGSISTLAWAWIQYLLDFQEGGSCLASMKYFSKDSDLTLAAWRKIQRFDLLGQFQSFDETIIYKLTLKC
jgi:hypothetical protein